MTSLEKTPRLKLPVRTKPYFEDLSPGVALGYRRNKGAGAWLVRVADGNRGNHIKGFAKADDFDAANGTAVLNYKQAHERAGKLAGPKHAQAVATGAIPITVDQAIDAYETDLETRGGDIQNAKRIRFYLTSFPLLRAMPVSLLKKKELQDWRNGLVTKGGPNGKVSRDTASRVCTSLKSALNLAASNDSDRIVNALEWKLGLAKLPENEIDDSKSNKIMSAELIGKFVNDAWLHGDEVGRQFQTLAETGARESQMLQIRISDLQEIHGVTRVMMPSSKKGRNRQVVRRPITISHQHYQQLKQASIGKRPNDMIFSKLTHIQRDFKTVADSIRGGSEHTPYSLRHSSIVRMLLAKVSPEIVARHHDTSAKMVQKHYASHILDVSDDIIRATLPDFTVPKSKVVRLGS